MKTIIFEKAKALLVDDEGEIDVEIFQNESGKFGVRLTSIYPDTSDLFCYLYDDLNTAHAKFEEMRGI